MKKLLVLFFSLFLLQGLSFANCEYSCVAPYDMNSKLSSVLGKVGGVNLVTRRVVENIVKKAILKNFKADNVDIKISSFSSKDLKEGRFRSASLVASNISSNNIYITKLSAKTLCDFNYIKVTDNDFYFVEDFPVSFEMEVTPDDLNKTMENESYKRLLNDLNKLGETYGYGLKISNTKMAVKNNKLYYAVYIEIPFIKNAQRVLLTSNISVIDGKIKFKNTTISAGQLSFNLSNLDFIMDYLNPLDYTINLFKDKDAIISIKNAKIRENKFIIEGVLVIPKG